MASPLDSMALPEFAADAQGRLKKDAQTRTGLERLVAMYPPTEALDKLRAQGAALPPAAQRELEDLYHRYAQYTQAVATRLPAGEGEDPRALARQQLATLKALRREYFGAAPAQQMFGAEERAAAAMLAGPAGP